MHIVVVTRHIARAAACYQPVLRALDDGETQVTLVGPLGTDMQIEERRGLHTREVALRPYGQRPVPFEWAVLAGDLVSMLEGRGPQHAQIDVLMSFEEDLDAAVRMAARAIRARLVVLATDAVAAPSLRSRAHDAITPAWSALRAQAKRLLPSALSTPLQTFDAPLQQAVQAAQNALQTPAVPDLVREVGEPAAKTLARAATELRAYATPPPIHYLLRKAPQNEAPSAGWTDFQFATGIDVEQYLAYGQGRDAAALQGETVRVGVYFDVFGDPFARQSILHDARRALEGRDAYVLQNFDIESLSPNASLANAQRRFLNTVDVAIVPPDDQYAAMQAAAAGCVVITETDSVAAHTFRDGESGFALPTLDAVQVGQILDLLGEDERRARMQDAAQRRALRLFDVQFFLRRLTRGMEENLQMEQGDAQPVERGMRRHI